MIVMLENWYALDIETNGLDWQDPNVALRGLGWYGVNECGEVSEGYLTNLEDIRHFLQTGPMFSARFVGHNSKFDARFLYARTGILIDFSFDTMLAAMLLPDRPRSLKLDRVAVAYGAAPASWKEDFVKDNTTVPDEILKEYCLTDCRYTFNLFKILASKIKQNQLVKFFKNFLMPLNNALVRLELNGFVLNKDRAQQYIITLDNDIQQALNHLRTNNEEYIKQIENKKLNELLAKRKTKPTPVQLKKLKARCAFNFNSSDQLAELLTLKKLPVPKVRGSISLSKATLSTYLGTDPIYQEIVHYRAILSVREQVLKWLAAASRDGRVHTTYTLNVASTGRLSSKEPNIQNIQRGKARELFTAPDGYTMVIVDYAQIEPRVAAHLSGDKHLLEIFDREEDFYSGVIKALLGLPYSINDIHKNRPDLRRIGKVVGLAILYGIGPGKLSKLLTKAKGSKVSYTYSMQCVERFYDAFPGLQKFKRNLIVNYDKNKRLYNIFGRPVDLDPDEVDHKAANAVIQSSASDLTCYAGLIKMPELIRDCKLAAKPAHIIHDEVVYYVKNEDVEQFKTLIPKAFIDPFKGWKVKLKAEVKTGDSWAVKN